MELKDLIEIKRVPSPRDEVPKSASDGKLEAKFREAKAQVLACRTGDYREFRTVAVCFRGNRDYRVKVM
jgi:hypothetical protein